jgi:formylglycine-generating enzyme required for sulfatase activity
MAQEELDSGIIVSRGQDSIEFRHLTFQDYLAALEVLETRSDAEQAEAYCQRWSERAGRTIRLPNEDEWYCAAGGSGPRKREYPWGDDEPEGDRANFGFEAKHVTPAGLFPCGGTPGTGILDLAGSVWEWTASPYEESRRARVVRGGSFDLNAWYLRAAYRIDFVPGRRIVYFGFRCIREVVFA